MNGYKVGDSAQQLGQRDSFEEFENNFRYLNEAGLVVNRQTGETEPSYGRYNVRSLSISHEPPPEMVKGRSEAYKVKSSKSSAPPPKSSSSSCCTCRSTALIICIVILVLIIIIGIVLLILFAVIPCSLIKKCHSNAWCKNRPFNPKCYCNYGYSGDGIKYCDVCGITYYTPDLKIVGGIPAVPYSWPATALIIFNYKTYINMGSNTYLYSYSAQCGGTLIDRDTVLTAAHCVQTTFLVSESTTSQARFPVSTNSFYKTIESMYTVYLGINNQDLIDQGLATGYQLSKVLVHPDYDSINVLNDIAIFKLVSQITPSEYIQAACLPDSSVRYYPSQVNISSYVNGWGDLYGNGTVSLPSVLQNVQLTIYDSSMCSGVYPTITKNWNNQICAGYLPGGKDSCQGDSGGSLYVNDTVNNRSTYVAAGIVSYGYKCALANTPGIYTRISAYMDWINDNK